MVGAFVDPAVHRRRFVQLGIGAFLVAGAGFAVRGLSRLVVSAETALLLGAPLLLAGFVLAIASFVLAVLVRSGALDLEEGP